MTQEIKLGLVGYGQNTTNSDPEAGGSGCCIWQPPLSRGVKAAAICDKGPHALGCVKNFPAFRVTGDFDTMLRKSPWTRS